MSGLFIDDEFSDITDEITDNRDNILKQFDDMLHDLKRDYQDRRDQLRKMKKAYERKLNKEKKKVKNNVNTGFTKKEPVPYKLAKYLGLPKGIDMPRTEVTKKLYAQLKETGLVYEHNKRVLRADKELRNIFNLSEEVNKSTKDNDKKGFNFYNLQSHIKKLYNKEKGVGKTIVRTNGITRFKESS